MTNELFQKIINEASDKDLVEAGIGCNDSGRISKKNFIPFTGMNITQ